MQIVPSRSQRLMPGPTRQYLGGYGTAVELSLSLTFLKTEAMGGSKANVTYGYVGKQKERRKELGDGKE